MNRLKIFAVIGIIAIISVTVIAVAYPAVFPQPYERFVIATTTSTVDTGLLDYLKPYFDNKFLANMTWLYLGTGQAVATAARGDADVLLVHDRVKENAFVASGNGTHRVTVMYNDFVILGPQNDPANINGLTNATEAFKGIASSGNANATTFISRGDKSGTNTAELKIWSLAKVTPKGKSWYFETGQGMSPTIRITNEKQGYTLSDRGTWIKLKFEMNASLTLRILAENDKILLNPYGIITLNSTKYSNINSDLAEKFFLFMISDEGQALIQNYKVNGQQVFFPVFGKPESIGLPSEATEVQYWTQKLSDNGMNAPSWVSSLMTSVILPSVNDERQYR